MKGAGINCLLSMPDGPTRPGMDANAEPGRLPGLPALERQTHNSSALSTRQGSPPRVYSAMGHALRVTWGIFLLGSHPHSLSAARCHPGVSESKDNRSIDRLNVPLPRQGGSLRSRRVSAAVWAHARAYKRMSRPV
jgi:hypothetical protein